MADPDMPAKNMLDTIETCASPPRMKPTSERAKATIRSVMPQAFISSPAMMKKGIARSVKLSTPTKARVTMLLIGSTGSDSSVTAVAMPNANAIGMLIRSRTKNVRKRIKSIAGQSSPTDLENRSRMTRSAQMRRIRPMEIGIAM